MNHLEAVGYRFNNDEERLEAEQWLRKHPSMIPPKETDVIVMPMVLLDWQKRRREMLAQWFGDWADTTGQPYSQVAARDGVRKQVIERAELSSDEHEILEALIDEMPRQEIVEYYNVERDPLGRLEQAIAQKIRKARMQ